MGTTEVVPCRRLGGLKASDVFGDAQLVSQLFRQRLPAVGRPAGSVDSEAFAERPQTTRIALGSAMTFSDNHAVYVVHRKNVFQSR